MRNYYHAAFQITQQGVQEEKLFGEVEEFICDWVRQKWGQLSLMMSSKSALKSTTVAILR